MSIDKTRHQHATEELHFSRFMQNASGILDLEDRTIRIECNNPFGVTIAMAIQDQVCRDFTHKSVLSVNPQFFWGASFNSVGEDFFVLEVSRSNPPT